MKYQNRIVRRFCFALSLAGILIAPTFASAKTTSAVSTNNTPSHSAPPPTTLNLSDFGAVGDGVVDNGPAFQSALNALAAAGGGTLLVPAGRYLVSTPVVKDFSAIPNGTFTIQGVPSSTMPAPVTAGGQDLSAGLDLTSEIIPATGAYLNTFTLSNASRLKIEHIAFVGREEQISDAFVVLYLDKIGQATIRHCEFYGLSAFGLVPGFGGGNMVRAVSSDLAIELSVFLGCAANSGAYAPIVENVSWRKFSISNSIFLDYGSQRFFGKMGLGAPLSWINAGNALARTPDSPRREFVIRDTFLDEGGWIGITAFPHLAGPPLEKIDLLYISGLKMNVSNLAMFGHSLYEVENVLIENSHYGWSHNAAAAIDIHRVGTAIFDKLTCIAHADRLMADDQTRRLTVINSIYAELASQAQITDVLTTAPEEDPVQYVRERFASALGRPMDPAAHFYWSDILIRCGEDNDCRNQQRAALEQYLSQNPQVDFSIAGIVVDEFGEPLSNTLVTVTGSQSVTALTSADGSFQISNLPTSGSYTVAASKLHYTFPSGGQTVLRPAGDVTVNFRGELTRHTIQGRIVRASGIGVSGITVKLAESPTTTVSTDANGNYSFSGLLDGGTYTVVPVSTLFVFTPATRTLTNLSADQTADFVADRESISIRGRVSDETGNPIPGITLNLTGLRWATVLTDSQGNYQFSNLPITGTYTVTASKPQYSFIPGSQQSFIYPADDVTADFIGFVSYAIGGRITRANGNGVAGLRVQLTQLPGTSTVTNANGNYSFPNLAAGRNYTVAPDSTNFVFTPASKTFADLSADQTANFVGQQTDFLLAGSVEDENGNPLSGVSVTLAGGTSASTVTDAQGNFRFADLPINGSYTLTVSKPHYNFLNSTQVLSNPTEDVSVEFQASLNRHIINGRIVRADGTAMSGVTVRLAKPDGTALVTTDANGFYSFTELAAGQNYSVFPSSSNAVFTPANLNFQDLGANSTANFVGKLRPRIMTIDGSDTAVALDSFTFFAEPFSIMSPLGGSSDGLTRLIIFATDFDTTDPSQISLFVDDNAGHIFPLTIEFMNDLANPSWLKQLNFKLSPNLPSSGCMKLRLSVGGVSSNDARICLGPR